MTRQSFSLGLFYLAFFALSLQGSSGDVSTNLTYLVNDGIRPYFYGYRREGIEDGEIDAAGTRIQKEVTIINGRDHDVSLDAHSFELVECPTTLKTDEFYEEDQLKIKQIYYKEVEECVKRKLGAELVVGFHHQVRNKDRNNGGPNVIDTSIQGYANGIHSDAHPETANGAFASVSANVSWHYVYGRYMYLNVWRNIDDEAPIVDDHLAVLDQTSLSHGLQSEDYIESDYYGKVHNFEFAIKQFGLNEKNSDKHRWFYFPNMTKPETIFFKQWDSDPERDTNICFHTAFSDPTAPKNHGPRQSIETRVIAYFPEHRPNTCPSKAFVLMVTLFIALAPHPWVASALAVAFLAIFAFTLKKCCCSRKISKTVKHD